MPNRRARFADQIIVLLFLIALIGYMPTARSADRWVWIGTLALLLLRSLWLLARRELYFVMDSNLFLYILLFLWGMASCFWSKNISEFKSYTLTSFPVVLCAVVCLSSYIGQRIDSDRFLHLVILAGLIAGARFCLYTDWSGLADGLYLRGSFGRLLDDVTNYNSYTAILTTPCVLALYCAIVKHQKKAVIPAIVLFAILLLGGSRKNLIAIPVTALLFSLFTGNSVKKFKVLLFLLLALLVSLYLLETLPALSGIRSSLEGMVNGLSQAEEATVDGSTQERMYLMDQGIRVWMEHPFAGVGWHNYRFYNDAKLYAHNNYVELLASLGIVGFLLYYAIFLREGFFLFTAFRRSRVRQEDVLLLGYAFNSLILEMGSITPYFKERQILLLVIFYWHGHDTGKKTYRFSLH